MQITHRVYPVVNKKFIARCMSGILFTIILLLIIELIARSTFIQSRVPVQAYGSNHIQFDFQIEYLKRYAIRYGSPECFIIGNSMTLRGINPQLLDAEIERLTGKKMMCYNFSVMGSTLAAVSTFTQILNEKYQPKLIILGTNFLDYTNKREQTNDSRFIENSWVQYQLGYFTLDGWLVDNSYAYRIIKLISYGAHQGFNYKQINNDIDEWRDLLSESGYGYSYEVTAVEKQPNKIEIKNVLKEFGDFSLSSRNFSALENIIDLAKKHAIQLVIIEMPYHPSLVEMIDEKGKPLPEKVKVDAFLQKVNKKLVLLQKENNFLYLQFRDISLFGNGSWHDRYHLNYKGGEIFSTWLADQLVKHGVVDKLCGRIK
jgi:hypothetical protein